MANSSCLTVNDYRWPGGWNNPAQAEANAKAYCQMLEAGHVLMFPDLPFELPTADREFLLAQKWSEDRLHKNISYRPLDNVMRGASGDTETIERLHSIMRNYSARVLSFLAQFLSPYAGRWMLDFSSFRPLEEKGRSLPLHKRNDLLHVDAFPSRPTRGGRIFRVFTNLNPTIPRVWETTGPFDAVARQYANDAGLQKFASGDSLISRTIASWGRLMGLREAQRTPYDKFMLRFHDYLKENSSFQSSSSKNRLEFPPLSTWMVYTDGVAHAALSGQYALEQTLIIPPDALVAPESAPYKILETIAGRSLVF